MAVGRVFFRNKQVACWNGNGRPVVNETQICFNGVCEDAHETCKISRSHDSDFNFCKTAQKPYDRYVVAVLCICHYFAPGALDISSDGEESDWMEGLRVAQVAFEQMGILAGKNLIIPPKVRGATKEPEVPNGTTMTRVLDTDALCQELATKLAGFDGETIAEIANRVFSDHVVYKGDSIFEIVKFTPA